MDAESFFLAKLDEIDRAIAFVCRRHGLHGDDAEDFACRAKLKILDRDYAVLRKFEARCSFHSYMVVVLSRMLLDERDHQRGKWRSSAEARRLGATAVQLETLLCRDGRTFDEAAEMMRATTAAQRRELSEIAACLPARKVRPREVSLETTGFDGIVSGETVVHNLQIGERNATARTIAAVLRREVSQLTEHERLVIRMRFEADMTVAEIARALQIPQKPIYRLLATQLKKLRKTLEREGISASDVDDVLGLSATPLDRSLALNRDDASAPPVAEE